MASNTTNLNLYKVDPLADKDSTFNIKTMLNDNWDKIDDFKENFDSHKADNSKQIPHLGTTTNSGDAYSITTTETINANQKFTIKFNAASSSAPTLKINTGTAYAVKKANGNNAKLYASVYTLFWDGTNFIQLGEGGEYGTVTADKVLTGYTFGTDNGLANGTMINRPTGTSVTSNWADGAGNLHSSIPFGAYINQGAGAVGTTEVFSYDANFIPANILSGKSIFGLVGSAIQAPTPTAGTTMAAWVSWTGHYASGPTMVKVKEVQINVAGTYTVSFIAQPDSTSCSGQIYVNGVARGAYHTSSSYTTGTRFTDDITVNVGDRVQLYMSGNNGVYPGGTTRDFIGYMSSSTPYATIIQQ